ncbi:DUF4145 domain-containing protein [Janthinobacterium sp. GMG1]|uniref:DUF4145 domain-containing protein n=1 Tax=Janthinobacterium sp. GMG1 TaxID=3096007 RepID=UPI002ACAA87D|nr:DUF4145 domain-containing protein [Janthinobacterium sp. GMG1]MDZ5634448.1 DUF4145 domain-containing protein [Janthinobacterium sp. GMG1]
MKCPHCQVEIHENFFSLPIRPPNSNIGYVGKHDGDFAYWVVEGMACPACGEAILKLRRGLGALFGSEKEYLVYPKKATRANAPKEVPQLIANDFNESCLVLEDSPKASAALSRRCLQATLRDKGYKQHDLVKAIQAAIDSNQLPTSVSENLDAVRNIGNFAAHPLKDTLSASIEAVEPHEAEWNLDVLEELFDFFYVQPERSKQKRASLDAKLATMGKPPMQ